MIRLVLITVATMTSFYRHNKLQAFFVFLGLVLGCALFSSVAQINASAKASYSEADKILGASAQLRITGRDKTEVTVADYIEIRRAGFTSVYPIIEARLASQDNSLVSLIATDLLALPLSESPIGNVADNPFSGTSWSSLTQPPYEVWVPPQTAARLGIIAGEQIELRNGDRLPPAVIRAQAQQNDRIFMDVGAALDFLNTDQFSYLASGAFTANDLDRFDKLFGDRLRLSTNTDAIDLEQLTQSLHTNLGALGLLSFVVGVFIVFNAVNFTLEARQQTLEIMKDLGTPDWCILSSILVEALTWALLGSVVGVLIAQPLSSGLMPAVASTMQNIFGASVSSNPSVDGELFLQAFLLASAGMFLALVLPIWRAVKSEASSARSANSLDSRAYKLSAALGLFILLAAALLYPHATTVFEGLALVSMVLLSGITLLPGLVVLGVWGAQKFLARSWMSRWTFGDVLLQFPHLRLSMMALLLTLVANIGVTSLVGSFRLALTDWLETRLSADLFVTSGAISATRLKDQSWVKDAHQRKIAEVDFSARTTQVIGISDSTPDFTASDIIDPLPDAFSLWRYSEAPTGVIFANEQVRYLAGIEQGERISLNSALGPRDFIVGGFLHDYGNINLTLYLPSKLFDSLYPNATSQGWGIWVNPGKMEEAELGLAELGIGAADWVSQRQIFDLSMAIFERTFAITGALNTLTLIVAAAAIFISLLAVYEYRRPEHALWRALGITWPTFFFVAGAPVFFICALSMALALPLGLALSWLLIDKINVVSFGWTMPLVVESGSIAFLFGLVGCAVLMAFGLASSGQKSEVNASLKELSSV